MNRVLALQKTQRAKKNTQSQSGNAMVGGGSALTIHGSVGELLSNLSLLLCH